MAVGSMICIDEMAGKSIMTSEKKEAVAEDEAGRTADCPVRDPSSCTDFSATWSSERLSRRQKYTAEAFLTVLGVFVTQLFSEPCL